MRSSPLILLALVLAAADFAAAQGHHYYGRNKVQYEDFDWQVLRTEHFDVYHDAAASELARIGAAEAEATYERLVHRFGIELSERVPLVFYATNIHFRQTNTIHGFIPQGVGGFFEFLKGRVVIPADGDIHRFRRVIRHELVHVFTFRRLTEVMREHRRPAQGLPPLWFTEGLAEYWSGEADHVHEMVMRDAVASNLLVRLEDLHRVAGFLVYKQGESVCRFVSERFGEEKLLLLIENVWRDADFRRVMEYVLGVDFEQLAEEYDRWVRARYYPILAEVTPGSLAARPLARAGYSGKPVSFTDRRGVSMVAFVANRKGHTNVYAAGPHESPAEPRLLVRGERGPRFEAFHPLESRMDVSTNRQLAFATQSGGSDVIHVYDLDADELVASHRPDALVAAYSPAWDPDGRRLAFAGVGRSGFADLFVLDAGTGEVDRLTTDEFDVRDPHWSPCGDWIVFSSDRGEAGETGGRNLFVLRLDDGVVRQLTFGARYDASPRWSPDGRFVTFTSSLRGTDGRFGNQDVRAIEFDAENGAPGAERRITALASAALDPQITDGRLVFTAYERGRFSVREMEADTIGLDAPSIAGAARSAPAPASGWHHPRLGVEGSSERTVRPYRRRYSLDVAQGAFATNPVWGSAGGATLALSDVLGDDRIFVTAYVAETPGRTIADGLNVGLSRVNLSGRMNLGYGLFRFSGLRYDRSDPDADAGYPVFFEQLTGGFGAISYPLSRFQRVELSGSLAWSSKEVGHQGAERQALLFGTALSFTHDNALYGANGPVQGWKARLTAGSTADLHFDNVGNYSLSADARHYLRIGQGATLASWGLVRTNQGREARLWLLGGSWDLRGFPFLSVRGRNQWFTSQELRLTLADAPSAYLPLLEPFGIRNVRGALFVDAARAWNDHYHQREQQLLTGRTLGAVGGGLRVNLFGGFVIRFDAGWRFEDGFKWGERRAFRQLFFGYDF